MRILSPIVGALGVLMVCSVASAQSVERGRQAYLDAEFEGAVEAFEGVLDGATLSPEDALEATRYLSALELMLDHLERARVHARAAVALDPQVRAPEGSPPAAEALLRETAREVDGAARLTIRSEGGTRVAARLSPVPEGLVTELRLRCGEDTERGAPPSVSLASTASGDVSCDAEAVTGAGASLFTTSQTIALGGAALALGPAGEEEREGGEGAPLWPWIVAGAGALAALGIVILVVAVVAGGGGDQASFGDTSVEGW